MGQGVQRGRMQGRFPNLQTRLRLKLGRLLDVFVLAWGFGLCLVWEVMYTAACALHY